MSCGKPPAELESGLPVKEAELWRELFKQVKLLVMALRLSVSLGKTQKSDSWGSHKDPYAPLWNAGFPNPLSEDPWILCTTDAIKGPLRLKELRLKDAVSGAVILTVRPKATRELYVAATRTRIAFFSVHGTRKFDVQVLGVVPYREIASADIRGLSLTVAPESGAALEALWTHHPIGLPILPQWFTALAVLGGADGAINTMATVDMDRSIRAAGASDEKSMLIDVLEQFAHAITDVSR